MISVSLHVQLGNGGWRKPLTMGNQQSEMKAEYNGMPGLREKYKFEEVYYPQNFNLQDHHKEGPSKVTDEVGHSSSLFFLNQN